ncbi:RNase P modulator RnpM [Paenibacillus caui]|uniref:RNase P modulator RnpM n=1 Tax=Paenibacillus caui TaxID=2873927 RepID=UPI001CA8E558|nr:YlxR family protein [Paenibacillus caui]
MKTRKIPLRKCVACQEMKPKKQLIRVVKTPEDVIMIDLTGKKSGRGAYLCGTEACFKLAHKNRSLDRALKSPVGAEIYEQLARDFVAAQDEFIASQSVSEDDE